MSAADAQQIDATLIDELALRYRQHATYARESGGTPLALEQWFRYFALENAAMLSADAVKVEGCSVDERAVAPAKPARLGAIFALLSSAVVPGSV